MAFKTRQQLADEFGISVRTLYRWLTKWNVHLPGGLIRPSDQDAIYRILGKPEKDNGQVEERKTARSSDYGEKNNRKKNRGSSNFS
ncbi:MAG: helix-turn-helix domain-containing protein [Saprospiraceae bacterium]|nr:helix-turn-helix domain-containing protein [Saprospiraceae bacterium]